MIKFFPLEKYKYYIGKNKVIAASSYAGHKVRGVAVCNPKDEFNLEAGKKLAALKCNRKIAMKRFKRAQDSVREAFNIYKNAQEHYDKMRNYYDDAYEALLDADRRLENMLDELK